jgi:RNA-directed DNA polymerase
MSSYANTRVDLAEFSDMPQFKLPICIDDMSLAHHLGIRNRTMWWLIRAKVHDDPKKQCYEVFDIPKRGGAGRRGGKRNIQNPIPRLKTLQRLILGRFLQGVPLGEHVGAYGPGRSCMDTAQQHVGRSVIISLDIRDFFPSIKRSMIRNYFKWVGYNHSVAGYLADLMTYKNFVPQGSPSSGLISNIIADFRFDQQVIAALSKVDPGWRYTRYSDDIDISHSEAQTQETVNEIVALVRDILDNAGFRLNTKKTKVEPYYRQQKVLGVVVNEKPNIPRREYDHIRCMIHNCVMHGFETQVARARKGSVNALKSHIRGKLSFFSQIDTQKAEALKAKFELAERIHVADDEVVAFD